MHRIAALVAPAALLWQCFAAGLPSLAADLPAAQSAQTDRRVGQEWAKRSSSGEEPQERNVAVYARSRAQNSEALAARSRESGAPPSSRADERSLPRSRSAYNDRPKILEFYATWCEPCKQMKPTVDTLKKRYGKEIEWVSCDVDDPANAELAKQYEICPIPALVFLNSQEDVVCYAIGCCPKSQEEVLVRQIEKIVPRQAIGVGIGAKGSPTAGMRKSVKQRKPISVRKSPSSLVRTMPARQAHIAH